MDMLIVLMARSMKNIVFKWSFSDVKMMNISVKMATLYLVMVINRFEVKTASSCVYRRQYLLEDLVLVDTPRLLSDIC